MDRVKRVKLIEISSVDPSAPTILRPRVRIPSTNLCLTFFNLNFNINCDVLKGRNKPKMRPGLANFLKNKEPSKMSNQLIKKHLIFLLKWLTFYLLNWFKVFNFDVWTSLFTKMLYNLWPSFVSCQYLGR